MSEINEQTAQGRTIQHRERPEHIAAYVTNAVPDSIITKNFGQSAYTQWNEQDQNNRRYVLWNQIGSDQLDMHRTIVAMLGESEQAQNGTQLMLRIEPSESDSIDAIIEAFQNISSQNIEIQADSEKSVDIRVLRDGWLTPDQLRTVHRHLGGTVARQLMNEALAQGHPAALVTMAQNLANPRFAPLGNNSAVVLGDGLRAWKRVESAIDDMIAEAKETFNPEVVERDQKKIHAELPRILAATNQGQGDALKNVIKDIANYVRGRRDPLLRRLGEPLADSQATILALDSLPLDLSRFNLPSDSVIAQAEGVLIQLSGQKPFVALPTLASQGSDLPVVQADKRDSDAYKKTVTDLKARKAGALLNDAERSELADIIEAARRDKQKVRIVTTNWNILRVLLDLAPDASPIPRTQNSVQQPVVINGVTIDVRGVASPANQLPDRTQVGQLGGLNNPIGYGQAVEVTDADGKVEAGFLYGYTPLGEARVLLNRGELLYTLSKGETIKLTDFPPLGWDAAIGHPKTSQWKEERIALTYPGNSATSKYGNLLQYREALRGLRTRSVAGSPHQVDTYTDLMRNAGFKSYIVGGATRDILIGKDPKDIDLASTMPAIDTFDAIVKNPEGLGKKSGRENQLEVRRNVPFGTVQVQPSDETGLDIISTHDASGHNASLRLDFDALARDFTINAVYYDVDDDVLIDPTGRGLDDLLTRSVRFIQGTANEVLAKEPVMLARWIKLMSKQDADSEYFKAANDQDKVDALDWLLRYADPAHMDERVRARFIDRMTTTAQEAEERVRRIFTGVSETSGDDAVNAIRQIYGLPPRTAAAAAVNQ